MLFDNRLIEDLLSGISVLPESPSSISSAYFLRVLADSTMHRFLVRACHDYAFEAWSKAGYNEIQSEETGWGLLSDSVRTWSWSMRVERVLGS